MADPLIGNSLFAIVLALMHVPPMFALLWVQRHLRTRMRAAASRLPVAELPGELSPVVEPQLALSSGS